MLEPAAPGLAVMVWVLVCSVLEAAAAPGRAWSHSGDRDGAGLTVAAVRHLAHLPSTPPSALVVQNSYEQTVYTIKVLLSSV